MPPKQKVPEKVAVAKEETNVFYVELKYNDVVDKLTVNSSCRVDIISDYARRHFLKFCSEKIAFVSAEETVDEALLQGLREYQGILQKSLPADILFQDGQGASVTCSEDTGRSGLSVFTPLGTYKLGVTKEDKSIAVLSN